MLTHGVLEEDSRQTRRPQLRFKDVIKRDLTDFSITPESWTLLSKDRSSWSSRLHGGRRSDTTSNIQKLHEKRIRRHRWSNWRSQSLSSMTNACPHTHTQLISYLISMTIWVWRIGISKFKTKFFHNLHLSLCIICEIDSHLFHLHNFLKIFPLWWAAQAVLPVPGFIIFF